MQSISAYELTRDLYALSQIGKGVEEGSITRLAFTEEEDQAIEYISHRATEIGLLTKYDSYGNLFCMQQDALRAHPIFIGSHLDSVISGGRFDGTVGIVVGLAVIRAMLKMKQRMAIPLVLAVFRAEEAVRFGRGDLGSRLAFGLLTQSEAEMIRDDTGVTLASCIDRYSLDCEKHITCEWMNSARAFIEVHIEQGNLLHERNIPIGIVRDIAAFERYRITVEGQSSHSGSTNYTCRRDALVAASQMVVALDRQFRRADCMEWPTVATIGKLVTPQGSINKVCGKVEMDVDIRDTDRERRTTFSRRFISECRRIARKHMVQVSVERMQYDDPACLSPMLTDVSIKCCTNAGVPFLEMASAAAHDTLIAALAGVPTAMLFVPSIGGYSHCPSEDTPIDPILMSAKLLLSIVNDSIHQNYTNTATTRAPG